MRVKRYIGKIIAMRDKISPAKPRIEINAFGIRITIKYGGRTAIAVDKNFSCLSIILGCILLAFREFVMLPTIPSPTPIAEVVIARNDSHIISFWTK